MRLRREGRHRRRAGADPAQRSCRLAGLLPRVRRTSVRDSSQTDGQLSHQAEAASGVAGAASRCRRGGRQTPGWTTCDSAARWPTSSVPPAIRHVLARGNGTSKRPARTPSGESERPEGYRALCCCGAISALSQVATDASALSRGCRATVPAVVGGSGSRGGFWRCDRAGACFRPQSSRAGGGGAW